MRYANRKNGITLGYGDVFSIRDEKHGAEEYQEYRTMIHTRPFNIFLALKGEDFQDRL